MTDARVVIERCRELASCTEEPGVTTRTFLSQPMIEVHARVRAWMVRAGMVVSVDAAGNIRGVYEADRPGAPRLYMGSHLDTVPDAGAFDGIIGVVMAIALVERLNGTRLPYSIEVLGFSEEEGVRFSLPFIGSRALVGTLDTDALARTDAHGVTVASAIRAYGLDAANLPQALAIDRTLGFFEIHIEQGPVLDRSGHSVAVVDAIVGQSRLELFFTGMANHAGTTPMAGRRDALAAAAEWLLAVEAFALTAPGLVATVGSLYAVPGATNVIAGECRATLDVRHGDDGARREAVRVLLTSAESIAAARGLSVSSRVTLDQRAVAMDAVLQRALSGGARRIGVEPRVMSSGAGHDAMVMASRMPVAMLFVRSPGGISHSPKEDVREQDLDVALNVASAFLEDLTHEVNA